MRKYIDFNVDALWIFGCELCQKNNHIFLDKLKMVVFHKCLTDIFNKILGTHVGNTILVDHNLVRTMKSPTKNVMLVEKWNGRVDVSLKYLMGEVLPYLEAFHSPNDSVFTFVEHKPFGAMQQIINSDTKF
jgi:hypothetical protein